MQNGSLVALDQVVNNGTVAHSFDRRAALDYAREQYELLKEFCSQVLQSGVDYAVIPGTQKPSLLQPGADKLCTLFQLTSTLEVVEKVQDWIGKETYGEPFFLFTYRCRIFRTGTDILLAEADGSCNSFEKGFRYRNGSRSCPECGSSDSLRKSKKEPGFYCWEKTGGCGATFSPNDLRITEQVVGQVKNPEIFDQVHAISMRSQKRAFVAAVRRATNSSEFFTQDMEDLALQYASKPEVSESSTAAPSASAPKAAVKKADRNSRLSNAETLGRLLDDHEIKDSEIRKDIAAQYLGGRKANEIPFQEFKAILSAIESSLTSPDPGEEESPDDPTGTDFHQD